MKSKRAQKELEKLEDFYLFSGWIASSDAYRIAEIAEKETEDRMREKAAKAFKFACTDNYGGECWANDDHHVKCSGKCAKMNDFIQKLNENEND